MPISPVTLFIVAAAVTPTDSYDSKLCVLAQQMIIGAPADSYRIDVLSGEGEGFHTIQMDAQAPDTVTIAVSSTDTKIDGSTIPAYVACKMINRARAADVLGLQASADEASCRDINEHTYGRALASLSPAERKRYLQSGRQLEFVADYIAASGGEWLPSGVAEFVRPTEAGLTVAAPSVQVPWDSTTREFYQGTHHCKLLTQATMRNWMLSGAFSNNDSLFPADDAACIAPHSMTSQVGSCRFWFAPAQAMFCQDFSGSGWTAAAAMEACSRRHASPEALAAADSRYEGTGGSYSEQSCVTRDDSPSPVGTCVFHCGADDETLWHTLDTSGSGPAAAGMMSRACDLYIDNP